MYQTFSSSLILLTWLSGKILVNSQDTCLLTNNGNGLPFFQGYSGSAGAPERRIQSQHQAIIPSYRFNCYGNITAWGVDVNPAQAEALFDFDLQVWRPSPTVNETGCYSLVGNFMVTSTSIPPTPEIEHVARVTPLPQDQLQFQPGDVLGFYVESHGTTSDDDNGVVLLNNASYTRELVWHASIATRASQMGSCPYPVGTAGVLNISTRAAPVISLSIATLSFASGSVILPKQSPPPNPPLNINCPTTDPNQSQMAAQRCISPTLVVEVAVPLVTIFGIVIVVATVVILLLYCKIRRLQNVTSTLPKPSSFPVERVYATTSDKVSLNRDSAFGYETPIDSTHTIRPKQNVAYAGTLEKRSNLNQSENNRF